MKIEPLETLMEEIAHGQEVDSVWEERWECSKFTRVSAGILGTRPGIDGGGE